MPPKPRLSRSGNRGHLYGKASVRKRLSRIARSEQKKSAAKRSALPHFETPVDRLVGQVTPKSRVAQLLIESELLKQPFSHAQNHLHAELVRRQNLLKRFNAVDAPPSNIKRQQEAVKHTLAALNEWERIQPQLKTQKGLENYLKEALPDVIREKKREAMAFEKVSGTPGQDINAHLGMMFSDYGLEIPGDLLRNLIGQKRQECAIFQACRNASQKLELKLSKNDMQFLEDRIRFFGELVSEMESIPAMSAAMKNQLQKYAQIKLKLEEGI